MAAKAARPIPSAPRPEAPPTSGETRPATASPATPPRPVGKGQRVGAGRTAASVAAPAVAASEASPCREGRAEAAAAQQRQAPACRRQQEGERAEPDHLHEEIGRDGAGPAQPVARGGARGMRQARIIDRPVASASASSTDRVTSKRPDASASRRSRKERAASGRSCRGEEARRIVVMRGARTSKVILPRWS